MSYNAWQLGEGGTCRMLKVSTNDRATFAKPVLYEVPTYLAGISFGTRIGIFN